MARKINNRKKEKIDFRYGLSQYWDFLKKYKWVFFLALLVVLLVEGTLVVDKFLYKSVIDNGANFVSGELSKESFINLLWIIAAIFGGAIIFRTFLKWINIHLLILLSSKLIFNIKRKYFNHILELSHDFHTNHKTGGLISKLTRGGRAIESLTDIIIFNFSPLFFQLIVAGFSIVYFSWIPALILFLTMTVFILYSLFIQKIQQSARVINIRTEDREKSNLADFMTNIDSIRYFGKEDKIKQRFKKLANKTKRTSIKNWNYFKWFDSGQTLILGIGTFFLLLFPIIDFLNQEISLGTLVFIYSVFGNMVGPMFGFVWGMRGFYRSMADLQPLLRYGKVKNEIRDKEKAEKLKIEKGDIDFEKVWFGYGKRIIFQGLNLKIPKGKKIALVGRSGCGKSTLVKLLFRLYDVNSGSIKIDNKDIRDVKKKSLRQEMSIVPQEPILFDDTIYNNVKFSNPKATKKEVMEAIKFSQLDKVINGFPKKEKTIVGERGVKLSGGEKQRVSIARAILANKKILVLDEATSSLDSETEAEIQKDLERLMRGRTNIIIAHRLSTIMNVDIIVVMREGKIVQKGTHRELITQGGEYQRLWDLQKGGYI